MAHLVAGLLNDDGRCGRALLAVKLDHPRFSRVDRCRFVLVYAAQRLSVDESLSTRFPRQRTSERIELPVWQVTSAFAGTTAWRRGRGTCLATVLSGL